MHISTFCAKKWFSSPKFTFSARRRKCLQNQSFIGCFEARFAKIQYFGEIPLFREKAPFSQKCRISRKYTISALFRPVYQISGPRTLPKSLFLARGAKIALWSTFSVKSTFLVKIAKFRPFCKKCRKSQKLHLFAPVQGMLTEPMIFWPLWGSFYWKVGF